MKCYNNWCFFVFALKMIIYTAIAYFVVTSCGKLTKLPRQYAFNFVA